jgi:NCS1 family nucleobase:cation symporter-1
MIYTLLGVLAGHPIGGATLAGLGINAGQLGCFLAFWAIQLYFIVHGMESIRKLETYTAPLKIAICFVLLWWVYGKVGGFGPLLAQPSQFVEGGPKAGLFWAAFWPSLTAMIGYWATLALNIPDFTRFAKTQRDQVIGQSLGLPLPMALLAALAVTVTSATVVLYGKALWDPVDVASRMTGIAVLVALLILLIDTASVNLAANMVGPAYDFSALSPERISYRLGGYITAGIALAMMPWKILEKTENYIFIWLTGYSALLGPIAGILIIDYYFIRKTELAVDQLYRDGGIYHYRGGWNPAALVAFGAGVLPNIPGFLNAAFPAAFPDVGAGFKTLYTYAWFVGIVISAIVYGLMMKGRAVPAMRPARSLD